MALEAVSNGHSEQWLTALEAVSNGHGEQWLTAANHGCATML